MEGDSLITDLLMTMANHLAFQDIVDIVSSDHSPALMSVLKDSLVKFITEKVLMGSGFTMRSITHVLKNIAADWFVHTVGIDNNDERLS